MIMTVDLTTFGETMVRFTPEGANVIEQSSSLNMYPAGSELNVAVAASRLGLSVSYISRLASNPLGRFINNKCREQGVSTKWMEWTEEERQGLYFFENGSPPRPGMAYYDRTDSAFSRIKPGDFDLSSILAETKIFFTSGISPALSEDAHNVTLEAVKTANQTGKKVAFDVNYRSMLWKPAAAKSRLEEYFPYVDILFTSAGDAMDVLGFSGPPGEKMIKEIAGQYNISTICLIFGPGEGDSLWQIICLSEGEIYQQGQQGKLETVDRLGAGDAFAGGFLSGYLESGPETGIKIGNAVMTLNNTFKGDLSWVTRQQVELYLQGNEQMLKR